MKRQIISVMLACLLWAVGFSQAQDQQGPEPPELLVRRTFRTWDRGSRRRVGPVCGWGHVAKV
jgi:hypothetical protein